VVGYECVQQQGYHLSPDIVVQICDPTSGEPLPTGQIGQIVATPFNDAYPLVRFGTGDLSYLMEGACSCGDPSDRIAPLQGRVGLAVKAREIFLYPVHIQQLAERVPGLRRAQAVVRRPAEREEVLLRAELEPDADEQSVLERIHEEFRSITRLGIDELELVSPGAIAGEEPFVVDRKDA